MNNFSAEYIGTIHTPFKDLKNMPIQPIGAPDTIGRIIIHEKFTPGLKDLEGFSHIYLFFHFHRSTRTELTVIPFMDTQKRGVFATRSPLRPSKLGMSIVELISIEDNCINVKAIDILDGTPLIDIKPYIPKFDQRENTRTGWIKASKDEINKKRSDNRFI